MSKIKDGRVVIDTEMDESGVDKGKRNIEGKLNGLKDTSNGLAGKMKTVAIAAVAAVSAKAIFEFGKMGVEAAATAEAMNAQFSQVFGDLEEEATASLNKIAEETNILPSRLKPAFTQMTAFAKTGGMETAEALDLASRATQAAADSAAFYDKSIEDVTESLQSYLKGNFENDAALGISSTETTRNAKANELYAMSFNELSESQKQLTLLAMVEDGNKLSGALGQAAREGESYENVLGNLKESWNLFMVEVGKPILPIVVKAMQLLTSVIGKATEALPKMVEWIQTLWDKMTTGTGVINSMLTGISDIWYQITEAFSSKDFSKVGELAGELIPFVIKSIIGGVPRLLEMGSNLINKLADGMGMSIPELMQMVMNVIVGFATGFIEGLPMIIETGVQVIEGLITGMQTALPVILETVSEVLRTLAFVIIENLPTFIDSAFQLIIAIADGVLQMLPVLVETFQSLLSSVVEFLTTNLPMILEVGVSILLALIDGIMIILPDLIETAIQLITTIVDMVVENLPLIIDAGIQILNSVVDGIIEELPTLITAAIDLVMALFTALIENLPTILAAGVELLLAIVDGISDAMPDLLAAADEIIDTVWDTLKEIDWLDLGWDVVSGIASGVANAGHLIWDKLKEAVSGAWQKTKEFFGIASPSRLMKNTIGKFIPEGIAVGIDDEADTVYKSANNLGEQVLSGLDNIQMPDLHAKGKMVSETTISQFGSATDMTNVERLLNELLTQRSAIMTDDGTVLGYYGAKFKAQFEQMDRMDAYGRGVSYP